MKSEAQFKSDKLAVLTDADNAGELIKAIDIFESKAVTHGNNQAAKVLYIKLKN